MGCAIERMLKVNTRLKLRNLRCCRLDTAVTTNTTAGLEHNTSLEELDLLENSELAAGDRGAVACAIERTLRVNTRLKAELNLSAVDLTLHAVATHIAAGLLGTQHQLCETQPLT